MKTQRPAPEAPTRARYFGITVVAFLLALAGVAVMLSLGPEGLEAQLASQPVLLPIGGLVVMGPVIAYSAWLFVQGSRSVALRRGRILQAIGATLFLLSVFVPIVLWKLAETIERAT